MVEKLISKRVVLRLAPNLVIHTTHSPALCARIPRPALIKYRNALIYRKSGGRMEPCRVQGSDGSGSSGTMRPHLCRIWAPRRSGEIAALAARGMPVSPLPLPCLRQVKIAQRCAGHQGLGARSTAAGGSGGR